jgi:hydroxylamine reductase (hybrid-cluster protein)
LHHTFRRCDIPNPLPLQAGDLRHIFLVGGCDAPEPSRKYYTEVARGLPPDTILLTLGCGKYRFYDQVSAGQADPAC